MKDDPIIFPTGGSLPKWFSTVDQLIELVKTYLNAENMMINCGHATALRPALEVLRDMPEVHGEYCIWEGGSEEALRASGSMVAKSNDRFFQLLSDLSRKASSRRQGCHRSHGVSEKWGIMIGRTILKIFEDCEGQITTA